MEQQREIEQSSMLKQLSDRASGYSINLNGRISRNLGRNPLRGGTAVVYHGTLIPNGTEVAIKTFHCTLSGSEADLKRIFREVHLWSKLRHENVVRMLGISTDFDSTVSIVSEWMSLGNAYTYVQTTENDPRPLLEDIASGLHYLHSHALGPVIHGDLKGPNVLVSTDRRALLSDFGLSTLNLSTFSMTIDTIRGGSCHWMAPELLDDCPASMASDVWAFGMTTLELFTRAAPFRDCRNPGSVFGRLLKWKLPPRPAEESTQFRLTDTWWEICISCWERYPSLRPTMKDILAHVKRAIFQFDRDRDLPHAPPEPKKERPDWFAVFNPKVKRVLDVTLVHTLIHESVVCCVRFSADGKYLATGCNRTAQIYDTKTGQKRCVLIDESAGKAGDLYIRSVCFSPDGKYLATGAEDKQIRIWDIAKKRIRNVFDGHQQEIYSLDFSLDGRLIVSGSGDKTARIWDMVDGTSKVLTINDPDSLNNDAGVTSAAISPNGQLVAAGSLDTVVRIWDVATGALVERLRGHRDSVYSVAFTPDGKGLVSGGLDKTLKYWDVSGLLTGGSQRKDGVANGKKDLEKTSQCTMNFVGHTDYVLSVAVSHDGQWVVSGSKDRSVLFWEAQSANVQCMLQGHKNSVISVDLSPTGNVLATGSGDWQARIWSYQTI